MIEKKRIVLVPEYLEKFSCIGSDCEDTCCVGWRVDIDQKTYKKYKNVNDREMKPLLNKHINRNRSNPTKTNYAKIVMNSDAACPLLNEDKLCSIQKTLGEDYLSNVCSTYPRITNLVNESLEKSAVLSCPETARLVLLNPNGIQFNEIEESINVRNIIIQQIDTEREMSMHKINGYFWDLRIFTIQVLQNRNYSMAHRLIILGMFYQKVQGYLLEGRLNEIPQQIFSYSSLIKDGSFREGLADISTSTTIQMQLLKALVDIRVSQGVSERYMECLSEVLEGIQYSEASTVEKIIERYQLAHSEYYAPFMTPNEYILENYLVNYVFKNLFPSTNNADIFDSYILLVVHYSLIKLHLIGMAGYHKEDFGVDHVIKLIQSFAKTVEHNPLYLREVIELLKKNDYSSMAYMAILINN
ncbi:flagellin lysine-N-methylase [Paenibacillus sp. G2S3]|uniref:flagellin lysine-N-methylase n=1 Tax=Paenibacillus sp. G2S3 TaxID=3047872 RepID=UPI0024C0ED2F|nr:flagellin lysine-N-methylase [Paenibacillus sp. G2S3]WHY19071.1 flagellin lysine-N-methylase [Paenibacillus sp. G2S3]